MKKFSDSGTGTKPVKYIITADNRLVPLTSLTNFTIESKEIPISSEPVSKSSEDLLNAVTDGNFELVKRLVQNGNGATFPTDCMGTSPLHVAAQYNLVQICELLLKCGFTKDLKNKLDKTPLHLAAYEGNYKIVDMFIDVGANINCQDMLNMTPLHWAVQYRHKGIVDLLLKSGALTELKNKFGLTPLDIAIQVNNAGMIESIQAYTSDSNAAAESLGTQLCTEIQNLQEVLQNDDYDEIDPQVFVNDDIQIENEKNINIEPMILNLRDTTDEYSRDTQNEDPVIIGLDNNIEEELPLITGKSNKFTNLRIVNGVIQSSREDSDNRLSPMQLLQEHGITMLQNHDNEENSILNAAIESGHSFVLTEVGKQVFKTVKQKQEKPISIDRPKKIIYKTVTPEQFLALRNNGDISKKNIQVRPLNLIRQPGILRKNRVTPFSNMIKNQNIQRSMKPKTEVQILNEKLDKAYQTIAEYKLKLTKKQEEVERYKFQLKLFTTI